MSDDVVWQVINDQFCSFKVKTSTTTFCRNENNVTGLCNRQSCPLANSQYATVRELDGQLCLLKKTVERSHTPAKQWERIVLPAGNKDAALAKISEELQYWSPFLLDKCRVRYERLGEVQKRMRRLLVRAKDEPILTNRANKVERRERGRERKAKAAARLELNIEKELVERLKQGVYGDMYNLHQKAFESVLEKHGTALELIEDEYEFVEGESELEYEYELEDDLEDGAHEAQQGITDVADIEDLSSKQGPKKPRRGPYVEVEYETEMENESIRK